jgi:hypothetical protein
MFKNFDMYTKCASLCNASIRYTYITVSLGLNMTQLLQEVHFK